MNIKKKAIVVIERLKTEYPVVRCALEYRQPHELLIATRLSAQCTDERVNIVTPALFERYGSVDEFAAAKPDEVAVFIRSCGLYKTKAQDIVEMCIQLRDNYGGVIPDSIDELTKLSGVGRKTANLIVGDLYGKTAFVCDTHVIRLSNRIGLAEGKDAGKIESALHAVVPENEGLGLCHRLVRHGRLVCSARKPLCDKCCLSDICEKRL